VRLTNPPERIEVIFHPSDFSEASDVAFAHALKIALVTGSTLNVLHVAEKGNADWSEFPGVRSTLERWRLIPKGSPKTAVGQLGIDVVKVIASSKNPVKASLGFLKDHPADLIVLAVHQHEGRMRWLEKRVGEPIARGADEMALYIPHRVEGFVSRKDGSVSLGNILIPVASKPSAQPAVNAVARLVRNLQLPAGKVTLLHVGPASEAPALSIPHDTRWSWTRMSAEGKPAEVILQKANETAAELIAMTTEGPHGFLDGLRGSTSEQVLRSARCPVANLP